MLEMLRKVEDAEMLGEDGDVELFHQHGSASSALTRDEASLSLLENLLFHYCDDDEVGVDNV